MVYLPMNVCTLLKEYICLALYVLSYSCIDL
jgi:hypothetical protein